MSSRDAAAFFSRPDPEAPAVLIYGSDTMRVALRRKELILALTGQNAEAEMRLVRMGPSDLRDGAGALADEVRTRGFYPGPRVVHLDGVGDAQSAAVLAALEGWQSGDAQIVATAGSLPARSSLRKLIEQHPGAVAIALYDDPPDRAELEGLLTGAGLIERTRDAEIAIADLAARLDPGDLRQTIDKIGLYKLGDTTPLDAAEISALAPLTTEAAIDIAVDAAADAEVDQIGPLMRRLEAQGVTPVAICIAAARHFRALFAAAADPGGPQAGIAKLKPPVWGPRRDRMRRQAQTWGASDLDAAVQIVVDTDLMLRSASQAPQMAVVERAMIRLAMMARRQRRL